MRRLKVWHRLKKSYYENEWQDLVSQCADRKLWPEIMNKADQLTSKALKKKGYKGKSTGERLVSAQHDLSLNDAVWFSHKYVTKLNEAQVDIRKLKKNDVMLVLAGFKRALKDLGAFKEKTDEQ
ncbi:MAG TPA: hypothetical protein VLF63_01210 [Patescibacteria group bacterium]|nr:hypothetical protein [Patescibacteria group bacterium]